MRTLCAGILLAGFCLPAGASFPDVAAGARLSTLGFGAEVTIGLVEQINVRVPFNFINYSDDLEEDGIDYEADLRWRSFGVLVDYHPFKGGFHVSGGLLSNGNKIDILATGDQNFEIGDREYRSDPNDPLSLTGKLDFNSVAPYLGIGWGNPILGNSNLYFKFELGVMFQGKPKVALRGDGSAVDSNDNSFDVNGDTLEAQVFRAELEDERRTLEDDISEFTLWPVLGISLGWRF